MPEHSGGDDASVPELGLARWAPWYVALPYLAVSLAWIALSDRVLAALVPDPDAALRLQTPKGWAFVVVTAAMLFWLVRRSVHALQASERARAAQALANAAAQERVQARLAASESRFRAFTEHFPGVAFIKDRDGRYVFANRAWEKTFGLDAPWEGRLDAELWPRSTAEQFNENDRQVMEHGKVVETVEVLPVAGEARFWLVVKFALPDTSPASERPGTDEGRGPYLGGLAIDITSRIAAEEGLRDSEERYRYLFEHNPQPMWVYDSETLRFLSVNQAAVSTYGYTEAEFLAMTIENIFPAEDVAPLRTALSGSNQGFQRSGPWHHLYRNGRVREVTITSHVLDFQGRPAQLVLPIDVTESLAARRALERQATQLEAQVQRRTSDLEGRIEEIERLNQDLSTSLAALEEAQRRAANIAQELSVRNRDLEAFAYTVSHDLRAPVRSVEGFSDALREDHGASLGSAGRAHLDRIVGAARRMDLLIDDLLTFGRLGQTGVTLVPVPLGPLLERSLAALAPMVERSGARVSVEGELPTVVADETILRQVVTNLLSNALKFTRQGESPLVTIRAEAEGRRVRLWFEDRGIGVPPEHRERIFSPFERLHGEEAYPGNGVGLAIVGRGTERMGGTAGVESREGGGSRFWIGLAAAGSP